jgi:hypothetical protein
MSTKIRHIEQAVFGGSCRQKPVSQAILVAALAIAGWSQTLSAADDYGYLNDSVITNNALSNIKGILGVNQAAGDFNLQANARAITDAQVGQAAAEIRQVSLLAGARSADVSTTSIGENAFQNTVGLLSINQASGSGNLEANSIVISPNILHGELSDDLLAQASLDVASFGDTEERKSSDTFRTVNVDETAFRGVRGVLQLNQAAGMHNVTQNRVIMQTR